MKVAKKVMKRYSEAFKRSVVREYEAGASETELRAKYGIGGTTTIGKWVKKYGRYGSRYELIVIQKPEEQNRVKELEKRVQELERALGQVTLEKLVLETLVEVIEEEAGIDVKKNIERSRLNGSRTKSKRGGTR